MVKTDPPSRQEILDILNELYKIDPERVTGFVKIILEMLKTDSTEQDRSLLRNYLNIFISRLDSFQPESPAGTDEQPIEPRSPVTAVEQVKELSASSQAGEGDSSEPAPEQGSMAQTPLATAEKERETSMELPVSGNGTVTESQEITEPVAVLPEGNGASEQVREYRKKYSFSKDVRAIISMIELRDWQGLRSDLTSLQTEDSQPWIQFFDLVIEATAEINGEKKEQFEAFAVALAQRFFSETAITPGDINYLVQKIETSVDSPAAMLLIPINQMLHEKILIARLAEMYRFWLLVFDQTRNALKGFGENRRNNLPGDLAAKLNDLENFQDWLLKIGQDILDLGFAWNEKKPLEQYESDVHAAKTAAEAYEKLLKQVSSLRGEIAGGKRGDLPGQAELDEIDWIISAIEDAVHSSINCLNNYQASPSSKESRCLLEAFKRDPLNPVLAALVDLLDGKAQPSTKPTPPTPPLPPPTTTPLEAQQPRPPEVRIYPRAPLPEARNQTVTEENKAGAWDLEWEGIRSDCLRQLELLDVSIEYRNRLAVLEKKLEPFMHVPESTVLKALIGVYLALIAGDYQAAQNKRWGSIRFNFIPNGSKLLTFIDIFTRLDKIQELLRTFDADTASQRIREFEKMYPILTHSPFLGRVKEHLKFVSDRRKIQNSPNPMKLTRDLQTIPEWFRLWNDEWFAYSDSITEAGVYFSRGDFKNAYNELLEVKDKSPYFSYISLSQFKGRIGQYLNELVELRERIERILSHPVSFTDSTKQLDDRKKELQEIAKKMKNGALKDFEDLPGYESGGRVEHWRRIIERLIDLWPPYEGNKPVIRNILKNGLDPIQDYVIEPLFSRLLQE